MSAHQHDKRIALLQAFNNGHYRQAQLLLESGMEVNYRDVQGNTPLVKAIVSSVEASMKRRLLRLLLASGADVNLPDPAGLTPVMHAVIQGELDSVAVLMTHETWDAKGQDQDGNSALMHAAMLGRKDIAGVLLKGLRNLQTIVCLGQKNAEGLNAEQLALVNAHYEVAAFLSEQSRFFPDLKHEFADLKFDSDTVTPLISVPNPPMDLIQVKEEHILTGSHVLNIDSSPDASLPSGAFHFLTIPADVDDKESDGDNMELNTRSKEALRRPRHSGLRLVSLEEGYQDELALDLADTPIMGLRPAPPRTFAVRTTRIGLEPVATLMKAPRQLRKLIDKDKPKKLMPPSRSRPPSPTPSPTREHLPQVTVASRAYPSVDWDIASLATPEPELKRALLPLEPLCFKEPELKLSRRRKASENSRCMFSTSFLAVHDTQLVKSMPDVSNNGSTVSLANAFARDQQGNERHPKILSSSLPALPLQSPPSFEAHNGSKVSSGTLFLPYVRNLSHVTAEPKSTIFQLATSTLHGLGMSR